MRKLCVFLFQLIWFSVLFYQSSPIVTRRGAQKAKIQTRAMVKSAVENRKPNAALLEAKRKAKLLKMQQPVTQIDGAVKDIFQNVNISHIIHIWWLFIIHILYIVSFLQAVNAKYMMQRPTGLVYDESMSQHRCLWDDKHPECPERFIRVLDRYD